MLKIALVSVLMALSIFLGLFPASKSAPHNYISSYLGYEEELHYGWYVFIGVIFYISSAFLSQQKDVQYLWK
tara:strand:+ start:1064 stop:1279 length:216 start_codon:yes stop_codon:yes gene_type:complete